MGLDLEASLVVGVEIRVGSSVHERFEAETGTALGATDMDASAVQEWLAKQSLGELRVFLAGSEYGDERPPRLFVGRELLHWSLRHESPGPPAGIGVADVQEALRTCRADLARASIGEAPALILLWYAS